MVAPGPLLLRCNMFVLHNGPRLLPLDRRARSFLLPSQISSASCPNRPYMNPAESRGMHAEILKACTPQTEEKSRSVASSL